MGIQVGETGEFPGGRRPSGRALNIVSPRRQKPILPVENPFPEKTEFRLGNYTLIEEKDDYLICKGFDPNTKNPSAQYTPPAIKTIKVAKPTLLQRTKWDGVTVVIGETEYTYAYSDEEIGVRTVTSDGDSEEERIDIPYFAGDIIVAVEVRENATLDGLDVNSEAGGRLSWMDLNVSGRHWQGPGGGPIDNGICGARVGAGLGSHGDDIADTGVLQLIFGDGNRIALYDEHDNDSAVSIHSYSQRASGSQSITNAGLSADTSYFVYVYNDTSVDPPELALELQEFAGGIIGNKDGALIKRLDFTRRCIGLVRTDSATKFNDTPALRHVFNFQNKEWKLIHADVDNPYTTSTFARHSISDPISILSGRVSMSLSTEPSFPKTIDQPMVIHANISDGIATVGSGKSPLGAAALYIRQVGTVGVYPTVIPIGNATNITLNAAMLAAGHQIDVISFPMHAIFQGHAMDLADGYDVSGGSLLELEVEWHGGTADHAHGLFGYFGGMVYM